MDKEEKKTKEMPEDPVEKTTGEEKIQEKAEEAVEKTQEEEKPIEESQSEPKKEEIKENVKEETVEESKQPSEEPVKDETEKIKDTPLETTEKPSDKKPEKKEEKKEKAKKKADHGPDFKYIVRLSNTDIDGEKNVVYGLTTVKGIGIHLASLIADQTKIDRYKKIGDLKDADIEKLQEFIDTIGEKIPIWMMNHRKDIETGDDIHLTGADIDLRLRDEINVLKKIRSYRGIRHERGLPVRGQRTRANNRKGLALGVSKKREQT